MSSVDCVVDEYQPLFSFFFSFSFFVEADVDVDVDDVGVRFRLFSVWSHFHQISSGLLTDVATVSGMFDLSAAMTSF